VGSRDSDADRGHLAIGNGKRMMSAVPAKWCLPMAHMHNDAKRFDIVLVPYSSPRLHEHVQSVHLHYSHVRLPIISVSVAGISIDNTYGGLAGPRGILCQRCVYY
jgi:hypothetical protein